MKFYKKNFFIKNKIAIIILVRLNSKRLKKKALLKIHDISIIEILIKRIIKKLPGQSVYICTDNNENSEFKKIAKKNKINFFRGSKKNIFKRILDLRKIYKFNHFVRVTGDNPFTNIDAIKKMSLIHMSGSYDYTYTNSLPIGTRPEIISLQALKRANSLAVDPSSSEYMTYFFKRKIFKIKKVNFKKTHPNQSYYQLTIDKLKDYKIMLKNFNKIELFMNDTKLIKKICKINKSFKILKLIKPKIKTSKYNVSFKNKISNEILD